MFAGIIVTFIALIAIRLFDVNVDNLNVFERLVQLVGLDVFNRVDDLQPSQDASKDCMLIVEPWRCGGRDEELGAVCSWTSIRHTDSVWSKESGISYQTPIIKRRGRAPVVFEIWGELVFELLPPDTSTTCSITQRVTGLDHELGDDTMEDNAFVVATTRVANKVLHCFGCLLREETNVDITNRGVDGGSVGKVGGPGGCGYGGRGCNGLLFASRLLVENVAIARLESEEYFINTAQT